MLQEGGINNAWDAGGLKFTDAMSFGLLPKFHDLLQGFAGEERMGPKQSDLLKAVEEEYPKGAAAGNIAGMAVPGLGVAKLAKAGGAGNVLAGMFGSGTANVTDQVVRNVTDDRPLDLGEAALSTAVGAGPGAGLKATGLAAKALKPVAMPAATSMLNKVLPAPIATTATSMVNSMPTSMTSLLPKGLLELGRDVGTFPGPVGSALATGGYARTPQQQQGARKRRRDRGGSS